MAEDQKNVFVLLVGGVKIKQWDEPVGMDRAKQTDDIIASARAFGGILMFETWRKVASRNYNDPIARDADE